MPIMVDFQKWMTYTYAMQAIACLLNLIDIWHFNCHLDDKMQLNETEHEQ